MFIEKFLNFCREKMAFFTRNGTSSVPEIPAAAIVAAGNGSTNETSEDDTKKFNFLLNRDGVEV